MNSKTDRTGVLFDLDETLIDRTATVRRYAAQFFSEHSKRIGLDESGFIRRFMTLDGNGYVARPVFFASVAAEFPGVGMNAGDIETHYSGAAWSSPVVIEGARAGLRALGRAGVPLGIVSNGGSANQRRKLENTGLGVLVDSVFISEEVGVKKPAAEIFMAASEALDIEPRSSWFVGDHPLLDIRASHEQGFRAIWVRRSTPWPAEVSPCYELAADDLMLAMSHLQAHLVVP
jgi:putative hydrolase of the HAD superfamily